MFRPQYRRPNLEFVITNFLDPASASWRMQVSKKMVQVAEHIDIDAKEFRQEAIRFIRNVVKAREYCLNRRIGKVIPESVTQPVIMLYNVHHSKWSPRGVAGFMLRYRDNLAMMMTGGDHQLETFKKLIEKAKYYAGIRQ